MAPIPSLNKRIKKLISNQSVFLNFTASSSSHATTSSHMQLSGE